MGHSRTDASGVQSHQYIAMLVEQKNIDGFIIDKLYLAIDTLS